MSNPNEKEIGMLTEVGDLGLGFDPLSDEEQEIVREQYKNEKDDNDQ